MARPSVLVSAHGGGALRAPDRNGIIQALEQAVALGVDYVELDVRRSRDGVLLLSHDRGYSSVADCGRSPTSTPTSSRTRSHLLRLDEALEVLAGQAGAHLDLKFRSPGSVHELAAATRSLDVLEARRGLVTTSNPRAIRAIRDWSRGASRC